MKSYDHKIGPYDAMKLVVKEDGCYMLLVCDESVEESTVQTPPSSIFILQALNKLADQIWIVCHSVNSYSVFKASIGMTWIEWLWSTFLPTQYVTLNALYSVSVHPIKKGRLSVPSVVP